MSEYIIVAVVFGAWGALIAFVIYLVMDDRRMDREWRALFDDSNVRYPMHDYPNYGAVYSAMAHVEDMPVGEGQRFETEEAKQAFLYGMRRGLGRVHAIDREIHGGVDAGDDEQ